MQQSTNEFSVAPAGRIENDLSLRVVEEADWKWQAQLSASRFVDEAAAHCQARLGWRSRRRLSTAGESTLFQSAISPPNNEPQQIEIRL